MDTTKPIGPFDPVDPSSNDEPAEPFDPTGRGDVPEPSQRAEERDSARESKPGRDPLDLDDLFDL